MKEKLPYIAVTMGDAAGVGPELCLLLAEENTITDVCVPVVFGDLSILADVAGAKELPFSIITLEDWKTQKLPEGKALLVDCGQLQACDVCVGEISAVCGRAAFVYINEAIDAALIGKVQAVVTAPIHKESFKSAGINYPGHTEIFAERAGMESSCMMLTSEKLTVSLVTTHLGYKDVVNSLNIESIYKVVKLTNAAMKKIRGTEKPHIAVCALNPHAGEHGLFGDSEEERIILPAIERSKDEGIDVFGPLPPDTAFVPTLREKTDAVVCMYHDQGLIPFKMTAFDTGVNITLGLKIVRTSVDHGTAFDIARQGIVNPRSMFEAVKLAVRMGKVYKSS